MRLEQLKYLQEIGRQRSMTKAAEILHISQPTLSEAIKNLENELEIELFERQHKGVRLTFAGEKTVEAAEQIFFQIEILHKEINALKHEKDKVEKNFNLETVSFIGNTYLIPFFKICREENWNISVTIRDAKEILERIIQKQVPAGIILSERDYFHRFKKASHSLMSWEIRKGNLKAIIHKEHPLNKYDIVPIRRFLQYPLLFFKNGCIPIQTILKPYGQPKSIIESNIYTLPQNFLCAEEGVCLSSSIITEYFQKYPFDQEDLVLKSLDVLIPVDLYLIMHQDYAENTAGKNFCEFVLKNFLAGQ